MSRAALRIYRALLRLLPRELYEAHGEEMTALLEEELAIARTRSAGTAALTYAIAIWDLIRCAPREHLRRRRLHRPREGTMLSVLADLRFALRSFARQKGASALILLTLTRWRRSFPRGAQPTPHRRRC